jgi:hypothetical protein
LNSWRKEKGMQTGMQREVPIEDGERADLHEIKSVGSSLHSPSPSLGRLGSFPVKQPPHVFPVKDPAQIY